MKMKQGNAPIERVSESWSGGGMQSYLLSNPTFRRLRVVKNMVLCKYER